MGRPRRRRSRAAFSQARRREPPPRSRMFHTQSRRREVPQRFFNPEEEMWVAFNPKPSRSRTLERRSMLVRSSSRILSKMVLPPPRDDYAIHCAVLQLPSDCFDGEAIRAAYLRASKRHHPDRGGDAAVFARIADAHSALMDRAHRSRARFPLPAAPHGHSSPPPHRLGDIEQCLRRKRPRARPTHRGLIVIKVQTVPTAQMSMCASHVCISMSRDPGSPFLEQFFNQQPPWNTMI